MFDKALIIAMFCIAASYQYTPFSACEKGPIPSSLRVEGCTTAPCRFVRGSNVKAEWDFEAVSDTEMLRPVVKARVSGFVIDYPFPQDNACETLSAGQCPLKKGDPVTYNINMPILPKYPKVSLQLIFSLVDNDENVHACFQLQAAVVDGFLRS